MYQGPLGKVTTTTKKLSHLFHRTRMNNPKINMAPQKMQNCQSSLEEEGQSCRYHLQIILQSYSSQNSIDTGAKTDIWINETEERAQK